LALLFLVAKGALLEKDALPSARCGRHRND
jgi:hypothetical protein